MAVVLPVKADAPSGTVTFSFDASTAPVYDLSGSFQIDQTLVGAGNTAVGLSYSIDLSQDVRGGLTGSGETFVAVGNDFVAAAYTVRGRISHVAGVTRVTLMVHLTGQDIVAGVDTPFNINVVYSLVVDSESGTLQGTARGRASFARLGSSPIRSDVAIGLPGGASGAWTLQMNIVPLGRLGGSAVIVLANGRTLQAHLGGSFSPALERSVVNVSGFADSRGNSVRVVFNEDLLLMRGSVLGQTVAQ